MREEELTSIERKIKESILKLKEIAITEAKIIKEINAIVSKFNELENSEEKKQTISYLNSLLVKLKEENDRIPSIIKEREEFLNKRDRLDELKIRGIPELPNLKKIEEPKKEEKLEKKIFPKKTSIKLEGLEEETLKRIKKGQKQKIVAREERKPSKYIQISNNLFSKIAIKLSEKEPFKFLERELIKANISMTSSSYISMIFLTTILSIIFSIFLLIFLLFYSISFTDPRFFIPVETPLLMRLKSVIWVLVVIPILTPLALYFYPSLERKSIESKINRELPFATIHMSAIAGSMIEPTVIFKILNMTKEYPALEVEFKKILNEVNVYGYNLVSALMKVSFNCPSKRLAELFNGMAMTITSGGDISEFFNKRSESLLFEYRIEKEKETKSAETFMDIYISVMIVTPVILMLVLMMISLSGMGTSLTSQSVSAILIGGVTIVNILFLTFLHLKSQNE